MAVTKPYKFIGFLPGALLGEEGGVVPYLLGRFHGHPCATIDALQVSG